MVMMARNSCLRRKDIGGVWSEMPEIFLIEQEIHLALIRAAHAFRESLTGG
jgi:hypothetical protein